MDMMTETPQDHTSRARRRPFTTWVKKLAHFKAGVSGDGRSAVTSKRHLAQMKLASKKRAAKNNPYPLSGRVGSIPSDSYGLGANTSVTNSYDDHSYRQHHHSHRNGSRPSFVTSQSGVASSSMSLGRSRRSSFVDDFSGSDDEQSPQTTRARSVAPTVSTDRDAQRSVLAPSNGAASTVTGTTSRTLNDRSSRRGGDSTFSSPAPSVRSLTTTLTTIQSLAPAGGGWQANGGGGGGGGGGAPSIGGTSGYGVALNNTHSHSTHGHHHHSSLQSTTQTIHFHQPFPSTPASAIPSHLTPSGATATNHPTTYSSATANNLLTDNASILTLASSSKRRRRRSLDTDASVRALAPSSIFGGSRESLPLSILSANIEAGGNAGIGSTNNNAGSMPATPGAPSHATSSRMSVASAGLASAAAAERTSIYSTTGALPNDRNSVYARQNVGGTGDGASMRSVRSGRSGFLGHGRSESVTGSIGGSLTSPLASPLTSPREATPAMPTGVLPVPAVAISKTATSSPSTPGGAGGAGTEVKKEIDEQMLEVEEEYQEQAKGATTAETAETAGKNPAEEN